MRRMADRVVLHVGLMKSGTTFVQGRLEANRDALAARGVLFPGPTWARQTRAVQDLIGSPHGRPGAWAELVAEVEAWPGTVVVSMEYLGPMASRRISQVVSDLAGTPVHAVVTVRDLGRAVPAMWQETLKNRQSWGWADFLADLREPSDEVGAGRRFWRQQDAARVVGRWVEGLGADRVTVVTVPPAGAPAEVLWDRFLAAAGLASVADVPWAEAPRANESLGLGSALLLARLNEQVADLDTATYNKQVKAFAKLGLAQRRAAEPTIGFAVPGWLHERADEVAAALATSGARVVGDLADLRPQDVPGADPASVDVAAERDSAVAALALLLRQGPPVRKGSWG
jgi:hypothetical protein